MPDVDIALPQLDAPWPPPGGGFIAVDWRQRVSMLAMRALGRAAPSFAPGISMMMLYLAFVPEAARRMDAVYEFDLSGPGGRIFTIVIRDGDCRITIGRADRKPDVVYEMEARTWHQMAAGLATGDEAMLLGKLRIKGDVELGRRFNEFFAPPGDQPVRAASLRPSNDAPSRLQIGSRLMRRVLRASRRAA